MMKLCFGILACVALAHGQIIPQQPAPDILLPLVSYPTMNAAVQPYYAHGSTNHLRAYYIFTNSAVVTVSSNGTNGPATNQAWTVTGTATWPATITQTNGGMFYTLAPVPHSRDALFVISNLYTTTDGMTWYTVGWHAGSGETLRLFRQTGPLSFNQITVTN